MLYKRTWPVKPPFHLAVEKCKIGASRSSISVSVWFHCLILHVYSTIFSIIKRSTLYFYVQCYCCLYRKVGNLPKVFFFCLSISNDLIFEGWQSGYEYVYEYTGRTIVGIHSLKEQNAAIELRSRVIVQAHNERTILVKVSLNSIIRLDVLTIYKS